MAESRLVPGKRRERICGGLIRTQPLAAHIPLGDAQVHGLMPDRVVIAERRASWCPSQLAPIRGLRQGNARLKGCPILSRCRSIEARTTRLDERRWWRPAGGNTPCQGRASLLHRLTGDLRGIRRAHLRSAYPRKRGQRGWIGRDPPPPMGLIERPPDHGVGLSDSRRRER